MAAYMLIQSASVLALRSKQEIIAGNLLREQIEIAKNIRNSNYLAFKRYNSREASASDKIPCSPTEVCDIDVGYFAFSNRYTSMDTPVQVSKIQSTPTGYNLPSNAGNGWRTPAPNEHKQSVVTEAGKMPTETLFRYCIDEYGRYRLDCSGAMVKMTPYYGFTLVRPLKTAGNTGGEFTVTGALQIDAYFMTTEGGYREFTLSSIIADFKK